MLLPLAVFAASELSVSTTVQFQKNNTTYQISLSQPGTITGNFAYDVVHSVFTAGTAVAFSSALPVGFIVVHNITTNAGRSVSFGTNSTALFGQVAPGEFNMFSMSNAGSNFWLQLDGATMASNNVRVFAVTK
jgi:hypothetical protein